MESSVIHWAILRDLRADITDGVYRPGDQIPPLRALAEQYGVSTQPARIALAVLRDEGLIYTVRGNGTYVADKEKPRM